MILFNNNNMNQKKMSLGVFLLLGMGLSSGFAQQAVTSSGGDASGNGGTAAYSFGQVFYTSNQSANGSVNQGVQQAYEIFTVGLKETNLDIQLVAFPNPTTDYLNLQVSEAGGKNLSYLLTDLQGKQIKTGAIKETETPIDLKELVSGIYFIQINEANKNLQTFKVVKNQ